MVTTDPYEDGTQEIRRDFTANDFRIVRALDSLLISTNRSGAYVLAPFPIGITDLSAATFEVDALEVFICDGGCRVHSGAGTGTQLVTVTDNALPV
jgi:hypothetical protein